MPDVSREPGRLKVGLVHWALPPTIGGVETHLADYMQLLKDRGVDVVAFTGERAPRRKLMRLGRVEVHRSLSLSGRGTSKDGWWHVMRLTWWFRHKCRKHGIEVIHGHNLHNFSTAPAVALNKVCAEQRIALHHTFHNYWADASKFAENVIEWETWSNSDFVAEQCLAYGGKPPATRYLGTRPDRFANKRKPFESRDIKATALEDAPVILQPARLLPWKGALSSVEMLANLHEDGYRVRLILTDTSKFIDWYRERDSLRSQLTRLIKQQGLTEWVTFRSASYWEMPKLYEDADIVINPSHEEPLGLVALEAMAAARPVVVTNSGGMAETVMRSTGSLIADDAQIVNHLYAAVKAYLDDTELAVKAGYEGRAHIEANFNMDDYADEMVVAYQKSREDLPRGEAKQQKHQRSAEPEVDIGAGAEAPLESIVMEAASR